MPAQGWAGAQAETPKLKCAVCARNGKLIDPITQISGTLVCLEHCAWIVLPFNDNAS